MDKKIINKIIDDEARSLVGKLLKRIEVTKYNISDNEKKILKNLFKELIYESGRNLEFFIKSFSMGYKNIEVTEFETR